MYSLHQIVLDRFPLSFTLKIYKNGSNVVLIGLYENLKLETFILSSQQAISKWEI